MQIWVQLSDNVIQHRGVTALDANVMWLFLQGSVKGSTMVAVKLWCRVYGTVWQTFVIPPHHFVFLVPKYYNHIIEKAGKQDDVWLEVTLTQDGEQQVIRQMKIILDYCL